MILPPGSAPDGVGGAVELNPRREPLIQTVKPPNFSKFRSRSCGLLPILPRSASSLWRTKLCSFPCRLCVFEIKRKRSRKGCRNVNRCTHFGRCLVLSCLVFDVLSCLWCGERQPDPQCYSGPALTLISSCCLRRPMVSYLGLHDFPA